MLSATWKSLRHRPTRTVIAIVQALVGALVVTLALALAFTQNRVANTTSDLTMFTAGTKAKTGSTWFSLFTSADLPKFQKLAPDVLKLDVLGNDYIPEVSVGQLRYKLSDSKATGPDYAAITGLKVLHGSYFNRQDVQKEAKVVVLAANTALALFGREDAVGESLSFSANTGPNSGKTQPYRVVGITEAARPGQQGIASPLFKPAGQSSSDKSSSLLMLARPGRLTQAKEQLLAAARQEYKNDGQVKTFATGGKSGFFYSSVTDPYGMNALNTNNAMLRTYYTIAALTLIVSSLGVLSALLVSVNERTRELGLRRAIGATRGRIVSSLLLETVLTTFLGGLVGVGLALLLAPTLNAQFSGLLSGNTLLVTPLLALGVLGLFVALSVLFGLVPALLGTRMRPTEALRVQG